MGARKSNVIRLSNRADVFCVTEGAPPLLARHDAAGTLPDSSVFSFFYQVLPEKRAEILQKCEKMRVVTDEAALEAAFSDDGVKTILVERGSRVAISDAMRICRRHARGKTVFFEAGENG